MGGPNPPAELTGTGGTLGGVLVPDIYGRGPYLPAVAEASRSAGIPRTAADARRRPLDILSDVRGASEPPPAHR
jgi:hypothetical protein